MHDAGVRRDRRHPLGLALSVGHGHRGCSDLGRIDVYIGQTCACCVDGLAVVGLTEDGVLDARIYR